MGSGRDSAIKKGSRAFLDASRMKYGVQSKSGETSFQLTAEIINGVL